MFVQEAAVHPVTNAMAALPVWMQIDVRQTHGQTLVEEASMQIPVTGSRGEPARRISVMEHWPIGAKSHPVEIIAVTQKAVVDRINAPGVVTIPVIKAIHENGS
ncbi:MAG: hypothetical protein C4527_13590 [Candidatus Omnitrophota bacterium]|nr:MAG: hypothetical protein C4527_13590 [Candidatus Omnitrophota bacterium]